MRIYVLLKTYCAMYRLLQVHLLKAIEVIEVENKFNLQNACKLKR